LGSILSFLTASAALVLYTCRTLVPDGPCVRKGAQCHLRKGQIPRDQLRAQLPKTPGRCPALDPVYVTGPSEGRNGYVVEWKSDRIPAARGGFELFRSESL